MTFLVIGLTHDQPQNKSTTVETSTATQGSEATVASSSSIPSLQIASKGRLPTKLHGFQFGMSVADVIGRNSDLKILGESGLEKLEGGPPPVDINQTLVQDLEGSFFTNLNFSNGRLNYITSALNNIRSEDAEEFDRTLLNQLGKPDVDVYKGPDTRWWVWIDGDVRILYSDVSNGHGRSVEIQMAVYPGLIRSIETGKPSTLFRNDVLLHQVKRDWGELREPRVIKQLPHDLHGLKLGMPPWQVREVIPGLEIGSISQHEAMGDLRTSTLNTSVSFWDGKLMSVSWNQLGVPSQQFDDMRKRLMAELGTPATEQLMMPDFESVQWEDEGVTVVFLAQRNVGKNWMSVTLRDKELIAISAQADPGYAKYLKTAPQPRSFF